MLRKICLLFLTVTLSLSAVCSVYGYESDIESHWAKASFERLEEKAIMQGYDDGTYRPENPITRAEFFTIVNRISHVMQNEGAVFSDLEANKWYKNEIDLAVTAKYASGYEDGSFRPEAYITRAEAAAVICKAFGGDIEKESDFSDKDSIAPWAKDYIDILVSGGFMKGYEDGSFKSSAYITRGEAATLFDRFVGDIYTKRENVTDAVFENNLIVGTSELIFKNTHFKGDIYLGAGVNSGEIRFIDCTIDAAVHMAGRNDAAVVFENTDCKKVCVNSTDKVSVISTGTSVIDNLVTRSEGSVLEMNTDKGIKNVTVYAKTELLGSFDEVTVAGGSGIVMLKEKIGKLTVMASTRPDIEISAAVDELDVKSGCVINGKNIYSGNSATISKNNNSGIEYSYTLSRYYNDDFESAPVTGGSRTEVQADKDYLLSSLTVSAGTLAPAFSPDVMEYSLSIPKATGSVRIIPQIDGVSECKVSGKEIKNGYLAEDFADGNEVVKIDVYNGLMKRNTYVVTVTAYGTDDVGLGGATLDLPHTLVKSSNGAKYTFTLTGNIDYSDGKIEAKVGVSAINPNSTVLMDGEETTEKTVDLYSEKKKSITVSVISEDTTESAEYTIEVERPHITELDDPDEAVVDRLLSNPESMTAEDAAPAKLYSINTDKLTKYQNYLKTIAYRAEGAALAEKQAVIQTAIDTVNTWDGKSFRIELDDYASWKGGVKSFTDDATQKYAISQEKVTVGSSAFANAPEGYYSIAIRWGERDGAKQNKVELNGENLHTGGTGKTWVGSADVRTTKLTTTTLEGYLNASGNTFVITTPGAATIMDYVEFTIDFTKTN